LTSIYEDVEFVYAFERWKSDITPDMIKQSWYVVYVSGQTSISFMPKHYYEEHHQFAIERSSPVISEIQLIKPKHEFIPAY
jgi:hypothetical protein